MIKLKPFLIFTIFVLFIGLFFIGSREVLAQEADTGTSEEAVGEAVEPQQESEEIVVEEDITAEDLGVSEPRILPDNPFYFLKNFWRGVRATFTFNPVKKAELRLRFANERLIEAKKIAEKTGKEEFFEKAIEGYQQEMERIRQRVEQLKSTAEENPRIDKFLDKFTEKSFKQQILIERLEKRLAQKAQGKALERLKEIKEEHLERFGKIIMHLEKNQERVQERIEKNLEKMKEGKFKHFKNLEVLIELEKKVPEEAKEAIRGAQENALKRLHGDLNNMSPEDQENFKEFLERVSGDETTRLEVLEKLREGKLAPVLKQQINEHRSKIQQRIKTMKQNLLELCPEKGESATIEELQKCVREKTRERVEEQKKEGLRENLKEKENKEESAREEDDKSSAEEPKKMFCPTFWEPVCGKDGKTYSNACFAKIAGVEIDYKGKCREENKPGSVAPRFKGSR